MGDTDPWGPRSIEEEADYLFFEEEGGEETNRKKKEAQEEVKKAGMLLFSGPEWKEKVKEKLIEACTDEKTLAPDDEIFRRLEKAGKATCLVVRRTNSAGRLRYFEDIKDQERLNKAKKSKGGCGTGLLMFPRSKFGWLVITNNHVIMDDKEAKSAEVKFDHLYDDSTATIKCFKVKKRVSKDIRTENAQDFRSLDFSVLALESDDTKECYLDERALTFDKTAAVSSSTHQDILKMSGLKFLPIIIIAFSHPHGLGKRVSIGKFLDNCQEYPLAHIKHELPTAPGCSGANLIYSYPENDHKFHLWEAAFVHYRNKNAVAWQAIGPLLRKDFESRNCKSEIL